MRIPLLGVLLAASLASALTPSQYWQDYYSSNTMGPTGEPIEVGSLVQVFDPDGVECGSFVVETPGQYGYLHVYGDDPLTQVDEGALEGDMLTWRVDGVVFIPDPVAVWQPDTVMPIRVDLMPTTIMYRPRIKAFNVVIVHVTRQISLGDTYEAFVPVATAEITDLNGTETVDSVVVVTPDGTQIPVPVEPTGKYRLILDPLHEYSGGTFTIAAADTGGLWSLPRTDEVPLITLSAPMLQSPLDDQTNISLNPKLDWSDTKGAAAYFLHATPISPDATADRDEGILGFLNFDHAVLTAPAIPTATSDFRIPLGRLQPETEYSWAAGAMNALADADWIEFKEVYSFTTAAGNVIEDIIPPQITSKPEVVALNHESVTIRWRTDELSDSRVIYSQFTNAPTDSVVDATMTTDHLVIVDGLESGTQYGIIVASTDFSGNQTRLIARAITTEAAPDESPPGFIIYPFAEGVDTDRVTLRWLNDEATIGEITLTDGETDTTVIVDQLIDLHRVTILGLQPGTLYTGSVTVYDAAGNGPTTVTKLAFRTKREADTVAPRPLSGPTAVSTHSNALISWLGDELHTARLALTDQEGSNLREFFMDEATLIHVVPVPALTPSTNYRFIVEMTDQNGNTSKTRPKGMHTLAAPDTTPPRLLLAPLTLYRSNRRIILLWVTDEPSDTYVEIWQDGVLARTVSRGNFVRVHRAMVTHLTPGSTYEFTVFSADASGNEVVWPEPEGGAEKITRGSRIAGREGGSFTTAVQPDEGPPIITDGPTVLARTASTVSIAWSTDEASNSVVHFGETGLSKLSRIAQAELENVVTLTENVTQHSVTITALKPATEYEYIIGSTDPSGNGETQSAKLTVTTDAEEDITPPVFTIAPRVTGRTDSRLTISWTTDEPSDSQIDYRVAGDPLTAVVPDLVTEHSVTLTNLAPMTTYELTVQSTDLSANGPTTAVITGTTDDLPDEYPPIFTSGPSIIADANQVRLTWQTDEPSDTWVEYGLTLAFGTAVSVQDFSTEHDIVVTGLLSDTTYYYSIASSDASGNIADSSSASLTWQTLAAPDTIPPAIVSNVQYTMGAYAVRLNWDENIEPDLAGYTIYRSVDAGEYATIANSISGASFLDEDVTIGHTYRYYLLAVDNSAQHNTSAPSDTLTAQPTANDAPTAPILETFDVTESQTPTLTIQNATPTSRAIASYSFALALDQNMTQIVAAQVGISPGAATTDWFVPLELDQNMSYWWTARAVDTENFSGPSATPQSFLVDTLFVGVTLSGFTAQPRHRTVAISWETASPLPDVDFYVVRSNSRTAAGQILNHFPVALIGTTYTYLDAAVDPGVIYYYRLEARLPDQSTVTFGPIAATAHVPQNLQLHNNHPNPFNPSTQVAYEIPQAAHVYLAVYDILGQLVRVLVDENHPPGYYIHTWDGTTNFRRPAASGVYIARLRVHPNVGASPVSTQVRVVRMLLLR